MNKSILAVIRCSLMFLVQAVAYAGSAQWDLNPSSGDWNTAANWAPTSLDQRPSRAESACDYNSSHRIVGQGFL